MAGFHRSTSLRGDGGYGAPPEDAVRAQREIEAALRALGWELDGPKRTSGGWKATIQRGTVSVLATGSKPVEVLEDLLRGAR